jgi:histidinol dehydrogenase
MKRVDWQQLDAAAQAAVLQRPRSQRAPALIESVARIFDQVRADGDHALRALTRRYDEVELAHFEVGATEWAAAQTEIGHALSDAIDQAHARLTAFHRAGMVADIALDTAPGVRCERIARPIAPVGLYVPAGSAPLPSTALMLGVPAQLAGCADVVLCTPPNRQGRADASVLQAAKRCGIARVFKLGGAQAIAAMALGTDSVPRCAKLFGPGNAYVTEAKRQAMLLDDGPAIDMPAGPSEVLVITDGSVDARFIAADLLAQAEHGPDSQVILVSTSSALIDAVQGALAAQLATLPRAAMAHQALACSCAIVVPTLALAFDIANRYAPEHLIVHVGEARSWLPQVRCAGSVFLGAHSPETVGDYCSGTNHVLPTGGAARAYSGVSVASFQKFITVQELTPAGLAEVGPCAMTLARAEGLHAHERAVALRLEHAS